MVKRIESTSSRTAAWTCVSRAASALEKNPHYRSDDKLALELVPRMIHFLLHSGLIRRLFTRRIAPAGIYEYVIARTHYIDDTYHRALQDDFDQILIFGAGFDTRALRCQPNCKQTTIFELDSKKTQQAKVAQYKKRGLMIPSNLVFIPIDFDKDDLPYKLDKAGFEKKKRSLFIMEGLLMYLKPKSVHETFKLIKKYSGERSRVVFDYIYDSVLKQENLYYGEEAIFQNVSKAGEAWQFGLKKGKLKDFLSEYDLVMLDHKDSEAFEKIYFTDPNGKNVGRVNGTHCLVTAEIA